MPTARLGGRQVESARRPAERGGSRPGKASPPVCSWLTSGRDYGDSVVPPPYRDENGRFGIGREYAESAQRM
ncbi:hypothetical protein FHX69_7441 [Prauserella muralis]|nr:hypothetical protein FHX69_7441 [Prauserella muralis]